jgi:outer membrane protein, heavy metal efflux system
MKRIRSIAAAAALMATATHADQHAMPQHGVARPVPAGLPLTLEGALALASGDQPGVEADRREAIASDEEAMAARGLPDPQLTTGIQNFPITGSEAFTANDFMTMLTVGLMREQVRRSKRDAQSAQIRAEALVSRRQADAEQRRIGRDVTLAWIDAVEATAKEQLIKRILQDLHTGHRVMEAGVQTGEAAPSLALEMDAEIGLEESLLADTKRAETHARAQLARWIGSAADRPLPETVPDILVPAESEALALTDHPSIQSAAAEQEAAERQVDVARESRQRDITWSVMLGFRPNFGQMATGTISIPLQTNRRNKQDRLIAAAQARADAASLRLEDARRDLEEQYRAARADYDGANAELERIDRDAIPALEAAFKTTEARYESGGGHESLDKAFEIVRRYSETMVKSTETRADRARAAATIIYVTGEAAQ